METNTVKPYGAWISPSGDLIIVPEEEHFQKAIEILNITEPAENLSWRDVYGRMFDQKYLRLIWLKDGVNYQLEYYANQSITWEQKTYVKHAEKVCFCGY